MDPKMILETAKHREETSAIEALMLMQEGDSILPELFRSADELNRRSQGIRVTFVRSRQINFTNICRAECAFCSFWRKKSQRTAYVLSPTDVIRQIRESNGVRQVTLQGGLNPDLTLAYHYDMLRSVKSEFPDLHIQGYSPSEIHFLSRRNRISAYDILRKMREAGLDSLSGDSADILNDKIRKKLAPDKLRTNDWIEIIRTAHHLSIPTTATILIGHVEDEIHISEHLDIIKNVQRETGGFSAFEPIPFVPARTDLARTKQLKPLTVERFFKVIAISRILFGKAIRNITIDWTKLGLDVAVRATTVGANDIGPVSVDSHEIRAPQANGKHSLPIASLQAAIKSADRVPVEREPYNAKMITFKPRVEEPVLV
ncbi:MAG: CofH family radical SAM protein [Planctomycetes bacterium]|nr:CofH family radical SAM protein [Planctomycetota bacterium]